MSSKSSLSKMKAGNPGISKLTFVGRRPVGGVIFYYTFEIKNYRPWFYLIYYSKNCKTNEVRNDHGTY